GFARWRGRRGPLPWWGPPARGSRASPTRSWARTSWRRARCGRATARGGTRRPGARWCRFREAARSWTRRACARWGSSARRASQTRSRRSTPWPRGAASGIARTAQSLAARCAAPWSPRGWRRGASCGARRCGPRRGGTRGPPGVSGRRRSAPSGAPTARRPTTWSARGGAAEPPTRRYGEGSRPPHGVARLEAPMRIVPFTALALVAALAAPALAPAAQADASVTTGVLNSFDGTPIVYTLFLPAGASADHPVPAVLMTHGWAGSRQTGTGGMVGRLLDAGFAVVTWDSRGFGQSGGFIELDSPAYEVRDASALVDMLAASPLIAQRDGDPLVGMAGGSYAGGIQLLTAAFDSRIDAIVPDITWNDLRQSLGPGGVPKEAWIAVLFGSGAATGEAYGLEPGNPTGPQAQGYDINLPLWYAEVHAVNGLTPDVSEGLRERSAAAWMSHIRAPALFTQGLPDTLFNANE